MLVQQDGKSSKYLMLELLIFLFGNLNIYFSKDSTKLLPN